MQATPEGGEGQFRSTSPAKDPREEIWKVMGLLGSLGLPWTALTELGVGCEKLKLPTLSVTGTACVSDSTPLPEMLKLKLATAGLLAVTVKGTFCALAASGTVAPVQVAGELPWQLTVIVLLYPPKAESVPLKVAV